MSDSGKLIALESADEVLAERAMQHLYRWLCAQAIPCEYTAAPTFGPVGAQIILHRTGRLRIDPLSLALVDLADRLDHLGRRDGILTWLEKGRLVLCRHYLLASLVHHLPHADFDWLLQVNAPCRRPDLTLYLAAEAEKDAQGRLYTSVVDHLRALGWPILVVDACCAGDEQVFAHCRAHLVEFLKLETLNHAP